MCELGDASVVRENGAAALHVGLARIEVTPKEPIRMAGYGARTKPSEGVADALYAKAMAVEGPSSEKAVLVTTDLVGFDRRFADAVCEDIRLRTGLRREQILINASHTHAGPLFGTRYPLVYDVSPEEDEQVRAYGETLRERMVELVAAALADLKPARLSWATGVASFAINRREFTREGLRIGVNPRGYVDRSVPVLRVEEPDGGLRGVVFGYACHNTTLIGDNLMISGDYAGFAQRYVEARNPETQAMFMQGCGASANPYPRGTYELACQHGETLGAEVCRVLGEEFQPVRGPLRVEFDRVDMPLDPKPTAEKLDLLRKDEPYGSRLADKFQEVIDKDEPWATHYRAPITVWQFGKDLTLVALPGDVVGEYAPLVERILGAVGLWIAGYSNAFFGYLRTARIYDEGGYEGCDFISGSGFLARSTEDVILRKVRQLAERAGRALPYASSE